MSDLISSIFPQPKGQQMTFRDLDNWFNEESMKLHNIVHPSDKSTGSGDVFAQGPTDLTEMLRNFDPLRGSTPPPAGATPPASNDLTERLKNFGSEPSPSITGSSTGATRTGNENIKEAQANVTFFKDLLAWDNGKKCYIEKNQAQFKLNARKEALEADPNARTYSYEGDGEYYFQRNGSLAVKNKQLIVMNIIDSSDPNKDTVNSSTPAPDYINERINGTVNRVSKSPYAETDVLAAAGFMGDINSDGSIKCGAKDRVVIQADGPLFNLTTNEYYDLATNTWKVGECSDTTAIIAANDINFMRDPVTGNFTANSNKVQYCIQKNGSMYRFPTDRTVEGVIRRNNAGAIVHNNNAKPFSTTSLIAGSGIVPEFKGVTNYPKWTLNSNGKEYSVRFNDPDACIIAEHGTETFVYCRLAGKSAAWVSKTDYEKSTGKKVPPKGPNSMAPATPAAPPPGGPAAPPAGPAAPLGAPLRL